MLDNKGFDLWADGYEIYGIDFSERMLEIAKEKMPLAKLVQYDFSRGFPEELENIQFDYIISTYAMHHLEDKDKIKFINKLKNQLSNDGEIIIGDIAFETRELLEQCKAKYENYWDDEEIYFAFDELKELFPKEDISFTTISHCSGIIQLRKLS